MSRPMIPATLDLADHARVAINALALAMNPQKDYEPFGSGVGQIFLAAKHLEALPMMRQMCGSDQHRDHEQAAMAHQVSLFGEDGLWYCPNNSPERRAGRGYQPTDEDYTTPYADARMMLTMMAWHQRDGDSRWLERIERMAHGLMKIAIRKDDYAYYPDAEYGFDWAYLKKSGWTQTAEPAGEHTGGEGTVRFYQANQIRALTRWWEMTGDESALELAGRLARFLTKPKFWEQSFVPDAAGLAHGHFRGHTHGAMTGIRGLLRYAMATNDNALLRFCQSSYEYLKQFTLPRIGWVSAWIGPNPIGHRIACETCTISGLIAVAAKLTEAGLGDYYDDIDAYARNHLIESQYSDEQRVTAICQANAQHLQQIAAGGWSRHNVLGGFQGASDLGGLYLMPCACCTGNASTALFYAWDSILRERDGNVDVNLLLNRQSPWVDVASWLPYEGKVRVRVKQATQVGVRLPGGVAGKGVGCQVSGVSSTALKPETRNLKPAFVGNRLVFTNLKPGDVIEITFPVTEQTTRLSIPGGQYCKEPSDIPEQLYDVTFRGSTVVKVTTIQGNTLIPAYPVRTYQREHYRATQAPLRTVRPFIAPFQIRW